VLRPKEGAPSFLDRLQDTLKSTWDIVHFAGHSYYDLNSKAGYVFVPGQTENAVEKLDIAHFSAWIRSSNLFYFSSCDSGAGPFMFELAQRQVPNMVGFRWEIEDDLAFEYTKAFYTNLFAARSLERAFLKSRRAMYDSFPQSVIWAAPLLIKQSPD
jgi:CHAT domain-containing protein